MSRRGWSIKPPVGATLDRAHPLAQGLVSLWLFNEGAGSRACDLARDNHGICVAAAGRWGASPLGVAALMTVGDARYSVPVATSPDLNLSRNLTIVGFVQRTSLTATPRGVLSMGTQGVYLRINSSHKIEFLKSATASILTGATDVNDATRAHQLAVTVDSGATANVAIYLDGRLDASGTTTATFSSAQDRRIGSDNGSGEGFDGRIISVGVWNRPLAAAEIAWLWGEPFAMIVPARPFALGEVAGGTDAAIDATPTALALPASAATIGTGASIAASPTAPTLPSSAATLASGAAIQATPVAPSLPGSAATIGAGASIGASPVPLALPTAPTSLTAGATLQAVAAALTLGQTSVVLGSGASVNVSTGALALPVQSAAIGSGAAVQATPVAVGLPAVAMVIDDGVAIVALWDALRPSDTWTADKPSAAFTAGRDF